MTTKTSIVQAEMQIEANGAVKEREIFTELIETTLGNYFKCVFTAYDREIQIF